MVGLPVEVTVVNQPLVTGDNASLFEPTAKQAAFLSAYAACGVQRHAAELAKIAYSSLFYWQRDCKGFKDAMAEAYELAVQRAEEEAWHRALEGDTEELFNAKGEKIGERLKKSDVLLIFMLKGAKPAKYRDNITVNVENQIAVIAQQTGASPEEVKKALTEAAQMVGK